MEQEKPQWEKVIDSWKFNFGDGNSGYFSVGEHKYVPYSQEYLKSFIRSLLISNTQSLIEKVEGVENVVKVSLDEYMKVVKGGNKDDMFDFGVSKTKNGVLKILKDSITE